MLDLGAIDPADVASVGGKGAGLAALLRVDGIRVPPGFCVTATAFARATADNAALADRLDRMADLAPDDLEGIGSLSREVRAIVSGLVVPAEEIAAALERHGAQGLYAVRSSATAEDLPSASSAGQQDSFLDVPGPAVLQHVSRCWASLFTERAVAYRLRGGVDPRDVRMAVVVQRMVRAGAAGVLFTADPITSNRRVVVVEAGPGLGDALVAGRVDPDRYEVRDSAIVGRAVATEPPTLSDAQVVALAGAGRRIEAQLGCPQDIEWCLDGDGFAFVQSRPVTTLFPVPAAGDDGNHVYLSVGHQQMMTDAMKPLGLSFWQRTTPRPMVVAAGRLFVDVTRVLGSPASRAGLLRAVGGGDPLTGDALRTLIERGFVSDLPDEDAPELVTGAEAPAPIETDPAIVADLVARNRASLATLERDIEATSGPALIDLVLADLAELKRVLFDPRGLQVILTAMEAAGWLNTHLQEWLGETNAADTLTKSVPGNVTSEMGLALMDVADAIRPHRAVVDVLERAGDGFLDDLLGVPGGREARDAIEGFLDSYGMRCVGEIDITRPRWRERPSTLVPIILGNVRTFAPGAGRRRFEEGRQEAAARERELLARLRALPDGATKAAEAKGMIDRVRTFSGYREYPKYGMVSRYFVYKRALVAEAGRLVAAGVLREAEDIFFLTLDELPGIVRGGSVDDALVDGRRAAFRSYEGLTPPRVITSDGEVLDGAYRRGGVPAEALAGLPVSAGVVEGRARVVHDIAHADLEAGDILVTSFTDPSWTPLFVAIDGLVTEVGGLMTHGAVIAREYGLPAVVGVRRATQLIADGQRIRVHGTDGYVELLP